MKANETKVKKFLSYNQIQFVIPVYQRKNDWKTSQSEKNLTNIIEVRRNDHMKGHFIGSIVYIHDDIYTSSEINELTIIDGQQRITTLTLIYIVLYQLADEMEDEIL